MKWIHPELEALQSGHGMQDGRGTDAGRTDGVKPIYPPTTSLCEGYNNITATSLKRPMSSFKLWQWWGMIKKCKHIYCICFIKSANNVSINIWLHLETTRKLYGYRLSIHFNSLRPSDAIWRQWFWTTLAQVMACCLTAPSHYLNQCWLIIRRVLWHTSGSSFAGIAQGIDSGYEFEKDIMKIIFKSPRGQWVNSLNLCDAYMLHWSGSLWVQVMA